MLQRWSFRGGASLFTLGMAASSCAWIIGFEDYSVAPASKGGSGGVGGSNTTTSSTGSISASSSGSSGPTGTGMVGTLGAPCQQTGTLACAGNAQKSKLICGPDRKWATNGTCDGDMLCDTTKGVGQGACKPMLAECAGKTPFDVFCEGTKRVNCGPDLVTIEELELCPNSCSAGVCVAPTCDSYCSLIGTNCKDWSVQQWSSAESCKAACSSFPLGTLADTTGNTLGCRLHYAGTAGKDAASAAMYCEHAGPTGGDRDPTATGAGNDGLCGDGVEAFCKIAQATCKDSNKQWATEADCVTAMKATAKIPVAYSQSDTHYKDFGCFFYHLSVAATDVLNALTHCKHINPAAAPQDLKCAW